ncbi:hypothetical protein [Syntrophus aciditrophicus]|uniref:hypothetical protein n=1 Tax=Syntrophus aciditrophicus TaxID=316277 RepID=UPI0011D0B2DB|nr:hypothetical protein [Syntrophus aciditrophicus]
MNGFLTNDFSRTGRAGRVIDIGKGKEAGVSRAINLGSRSESSISRHLGVSSLVRFSHGKLNHNHER